MSIKLLHNLIAVRETVYASDGAIQLIKQEKKERGSVVAAGPGIHDRKGNLIATTVKIGDEVLFNKGSGNTIIVDGEALLVMPETNIIGILK